MGVKIQGGILVNPGEYSVFWENPWGDSESPGGVLKIQGGGVIQMEVVIFLTYYKQSSIFHFLENLGGILKSRKVF